MKFSVIIPVYNAERYLERSISSLLNQTFTDFELLLINDGSKDNSLEILREYEEEDPRIKVFSHNNKGVSVTRNVGIENAAGEYLLFVDADDYVTEDYLQRFANIVLQYGEDVFFIQNIEVLYSTGKNPHAWAKGDDKNKLPENYLYDFKEGLVGREEFILQNNIFDVPHPFGKLYKRKIILENKIRFDPDIEMGEDMIFLFYYLRFVKEIFISNQIGYIYDCRNENSAFISKMNAENDIKLFNKLWEINENYFRMNPAYAKLCTKLNYKLYLLFIYPEDFYGSLKHKMLFLRTKVVSNPNYEKILKKYFPGRIRTVEMQAIKRNYFLIYWLISNFLKVK